MRIKGMLVAGLLLLLLLASGSGAGSQQSTTDEAESIALRPVRDGAPAITLRAASGATTRFMTQNGQAIDSVPPEGMDLPRLVLYRNGALTSPEERTLIVTVSDLVVPPSGLTVTLTLQTYHGDPDLGGGLEHRITVWRASKRLGNSPVLDQTGRSVVFDHEFGEAVMSGPERIATPTDYFRLELTIIDEGPSASAPVYTFSQDHAFLMENQWSIPLKLQQTESKGAAPEELVVYYCDMFVFQKDTDDPATRLRREEIPQYVERVLAPAMLEAFRVQTEEWGFPWQQAWTSYRAGDGKERLSVALSDGDVWFHGQAPMRGHSGISIRTNGGAHRNYETLTAGLLSTFHHELFHNLQKGVVQEFGGHGDADGQDRAWGFFAEGTAVLAESVAQPAAQFTETSGSRTFMSHANGFIGRTSFHGELNSSYAEMTPYRAALYWRFLYEQCGGMVNGAEDPRAGMRVIRRSLEVLYSRAEVDITKSAGLAHTLPAVMDQVLNGPNAPSCPFWTFRESLQRFARAIYQLRLESGRCTAPDTPDGCGFYDPDRLYFDPPVGTITYSGEQVVFEAADQPYPRGIRSSFGIDFVDVELDPGTQGQPLTIEFFGAPGGDAEFGVEIWKLMDFRIPGGSQRRPLPVATPERLGDVATDGRLLYTIPEIDTGRINKLGLIISRLDSEEDSDPVGTYTMILKPGLGL